MSALQENHSCENRRTEPEPHCEVASQAPAFLICVGKRQAIYFGGNDELHERIDLELLAIGKRSGLSFVEINEFRVRDLLDYVDVFTRPSKKSQRRKATQEDIDKFFA